MRGVALPAALICAALGLFLAFAPRRAVVPALVALCLVATALSFLPFPTNRAEIVFAGCWISVILLAAGVHLPRTVRVEFAIIAAVDAGIWAGMLVSVEGVRTDLFRALPAVLIVFPARWVVSRGWQIAIKVVSSWLIAVSLLVALLPAQHTPGYLPDHMD